VKVFIGQTVSFNFQNAANVADGTYSSTQGECLSIDEFAIVVKTTSDGKIRLYRWVGDYVSAFQQV
jgi:hypothetical protein